MRLTSKVWTSVNTKSVVTGVIIALAVVAFAITGLGGRIGRSFDANTAAKVGNQEISMRALSELVQQYDREAGNTRDDPNRHKANVQNALNQLIQSKLLLEESYRIGWNGTDREVANWIRKVPTFQDKETKQFRMEYYQRFMQSGQMTELELYQNGRDSIAQGKMQSLLMLPAYVPEKFVAEAMARDGVEFDFESLEIKPSPEALKKAQSEAAKAFASDEKNKAHLNDLWEKSKSEFEHKAQTGVRTILVAWKGAEKAQGDALKRSEEEASELANKLRSRIAGGEPFASVATQTNDDLGAKVKSGDLGWVDESSIDPESFEAIKKLSAGNKLSPVVKTKFGFRILEWADARPEVKKTFEEVKEELASRIVAGDINQKLVSELGAEFGKIVSAGDKIKLEELAKQKGLAWTKVGKPVTAATKFIEGLGATDALLPHIFKLRNPGEMANSLISTGGRSFVFRLIARRDPPKSTPEQIAEHGRSEQYAFFRSFDQQVHRKLFEVYGREKEISVNPGLNTEQ